MATIKIEIVAGVNTYAHVKTVTAAHLQRLAASIRYRFGQVDDGAGGTRDMTDAEAMSRYAQWLFSLTVNGVRETERTSAQETVNTIDLT